MVTASRVARHAMPRARLLPTAAAEQLLVVGAQLVSGVTNFAFSIVMAHVLAPADFSVFRAFLALYLVVHIPTGSISAATSLKPELEKSGAARLLRIAVTISFAVLVGCVPLGSVLSIPPGFVVALATTVPAAGLLALRRGRLWGIGRPDLGAASLLVDAGGRFALGVALGALAGPLGAAAGVVLGGYAALALVSGRRSGRATASADGSEAGAGRGTGWTMAAFLLLALIQNQDLLFANKLLPAAEAARFAGVSTLGGIAVFVTTGIPTLLLPRAARGERQALRIALALAALLGGLAVAVVAVAPARVAAVALGERYASVGSLLVPYMAAMAVFGVGRVLVAQRCAVGRVRGMVVFLGVVAAGHAVLLGSVADSAGDVVTITLAATAVLGAAAGTVVFLPERRAASIGLRQRISSPRFLLGLACFVGLALRLIAPRGLWVDEAITVAKAQLPFGDMISNLAANDVHPPLHYAVVWAVTRGLGIGEFAVRIPSMIAGALLVPVLYALGRDLFDRRTGLIAAGMASVSPLLIWYSQEARMYALLMLFSALAMWAQVRILERSSAPAWALYALATVAMLWTQYFAVLQVVVQQLVFMVVALRAKRDGRRLGPLLAGWVLSGAAVAAAVIPLAGFALEQFHANQARYASGHVPANVGRAVSDTREGMSVYTLIANSVWAVVGYHSDRTMSQIVALWPLGMGAALVLLGRGRPSRSSLFLLAAAVVPILALFAIGYQARNVFEVRYFATAIPLLVVAGARLITRCATRPRVMKGAAACALALLLVAGVDQQINGTNPRIFDFRGALEEISARASSDDVVLYEPGFLDTVVGYYVPGLDARSASAGIPGPEPGRRVFLVGSFLDDKGFSGQTGSALAELEQEHVLVDRFHRPQVRVWVFASAHTGLDERSFTSSRERP